MMTRRRWVVLGVALVVLAMVVAGVLSWRSVFSGDEAPVSSLTNATPVVVSSSPSQQPPVITTTPPPTQEKVAAVSPPPSPAAPVSSPTSRPSVPRSNFFGMQLALGSQWEVLRQKPYTDGEGRVMVVDVSKCSIDMDWSYCPGFVVVWTQLTADTYLPYGKPDAGNCSWNQIQDDSYFHSTPQAAGTTKVGKVSASHQTQERCLGETLSNPDPSDLQHSWVIADKGILVYDLNRDDPKPLPGLEELLASATWAS